MRRQRRSHEQLLDHLKSLNSSENSRWQRKRDLGVQNIRWSLLGASDQNESDIAFELLPLDQKRRTADDRVVGAGAGDHAVDEGPTEGHNIKVTGLHRRSVTGDVVAFEQHDRRLVRRRERVLDLKEDGPELGKLFEA